MINPAPLHNPFMSLSVLSLCISLAACGGSDTPEDLAAAPSAAETLETIAAVNAATSLTRPSVAGFDRQAAGSALSVTATPNPPRLVAVATKPGTVPSTTDAASSPETAGVPPASRDASPTAAPPLTPQDEPPVPSGIVLDGTVVPGTYAPGCTPTVFTDYMDTLNWDTRHVEPRDCAIVKVSTPVFSWRQPWDGDLSAPYTFELRTAAGGLVASRSTHTPRLFLAETPLAPGNYTWKISYRNKSGSMISSASRRFNISAQAVGIQIPSAAKIVDLAMRKPHPRELPAGASFAAIANAALGGEYSASFNAYMKAATTYRAEAPPPPPADLTRADFSSDMAYVSWQQELQRIAIKERNAIEYLGYAARFSDDRSYAIAGAARLANLAAWPVRGATSDKSLFRANREIYVSLALGLDLYPSDLLTPTQTAAIVAALKDRVSQVVQKLPSLDASPYQSTLLNSCNYIVVALLHSVGTAAFPEAQDWLRQAWDAWITTQGTWGVDGSFGQSTAYAWWEGRSSAETVATVRLVTGLDLAHLPNFAHFGDNMIAFTAPAIALPSPFGDASENSGLYASNSWNVYRLYAALTRLPAHEWYWRVAPDNVSKAAALSARNYLLLGLNLPAVSPVAPASNSWVFEDAGLVAMHSSTADPDRSSLFFRSSRFGSFNHATADNNAFVFVSRGQPLFISGGYYPYYMSPHHALVGRATRFKNALTFDGGIGQAEPSTRPTAPGKPVHSMNSRAQLINFHDDGTWAVASGDATLTYRGYDSSTYTWTPLLSNAVRTVAYNRSERVAVIYDWATSAAARTWELNFQMQNAPTLAGRTLRAASGDALGCVDVYNAPGAFTVTKGFPVAPENGLPDEYQARYSASHASTELVAITVIREDCRDVPVRVEVAATTASVAIDGSAPLVMDRRTVAIH